jgi:hypothetical protein
LKGISVTWSSGIQDEEAVQSLAATVGLITSLYHSKWPWGIIEPLVALRPFGSWVIPALPEGSPYASFDWYVESSLDQAQQAVESETFLDAIEAEPWQQEDHHFDLSLIHLPLRASASPDELPFAARPGLAAVISADWLRAYGNVEKERLTLRRLCFHALGSALGLDAHASSSPPCAMRPFRDREQLWTLAEEEHGARTIFCDRHYRDMLSILLSGRGPLS